MADKSPDAFRTISEVAEDLDLPQHVLRFWETRFTQIKPLKRGGGRRYYRPDDVALIIGLKTLLYGQGYTIKGVQRILKEQGVRAVQAVGRGGSIPAPAHLAAMAGAVGDSLAEESDVTGQATGDGLGTAQSPATVPQSAPPPAAQKPQPAQNADALLRSALSELSTARNMLARVLGNRTESQ